MYCSISFGIFCIITINSDYNHAFIRNFLQNYNKFRLFLVYQSRDKNVAFLMHSTCHHPAGSEIDASIIYADYYYIEALLRLKELNK